MLSSGQMQLILLPAPTKNKFDLFTPACNVSSRSERSILFAFFRAAPQSASNQAAAECGYFGLPLGTESKNQHLLIDLLILGQASPLASASGSHLLIGTPGFEIEGGHSIVFRWLQADLTVIFRQKPLVFFDRNVDGIEDAILGSQFADLVKRGLLVLVEWGRIADKDDHFFGKGPPRETIDRSADRAECILLPSSAILSADIV